MSGVQYLVLCVYLSATTGAYLSRNVRQGDSTGAPSCRSVHVLLRRINSWFCGTQRRLQPRQAVSLHPRPCNILCFLFHFLSRHLSSSTCQLNVQSFPLVSSPPLLSSLSSLPPSLLSLLIDLRRSEQKLHSIPSVTQYQAHPAGLSRSLTNSHGVILPHTICVRR